MVHLVPLVAWLFYKEIVRLYGLPEFIVSDRDSKLTSCWWREIHCICGTKLLMSASFHPQTDGILERTICTVGQILCTLVESDQTDWLCRIPMVKFALNSSVSASTGFALFKLNYRWRPRMIDIPSESA